MTALKDEFTSTGKKFYHHQEAMKNLRNGKGQPIVTHVMSTDICSHSCAFCSVHHRAGDVLPLADITAYLDILIPFGLKAVILSGGGNPILYKCPKTGANFNALVEAIHSRGLEIGLITDGMPLKKFQDGDGIRESWGTVWPRTLDKLTWIRISMAGLDHEENEVYVPDIDPSKTTLGFSYVLHDEYRTEADKYHGKVSTQADLLSLGVSMVRPTRAATDRIPELTGQIAHYVETYHPKYVRLLPNCLEPYKISERCHQLQEMANVIDPDIVFVQYKPPAPPSKCFLGYIHPVLNSDGYVLPCDSACLNESSGHKLGEPWRICHWSEIARIYTEPVRSLIKDPKTLCPGCVFTRSNQILETVVDGTADLTPPSSVPEHANFV